MWSTFFKGLPWLFLHQIYTTTESSLPGQRSLRLKLPVGADSWLRGVTALIRAVSGEKQIYSGNLEILPGIGKPGKFFGKYKIFSGH